MKIFDPKKLLVIAGPCSLENESICRQVAKTLQDIAKRYHDKLNIVFKGSFDKANRTSLSSHRGPGQEEGLELLAMVKKDYNLPTTTDLHLPDQAHHIAKVVDLLQIPAFLCRQTDLLLAAAKTGKAVSVKKGQFLSPHEMKFVVQKLESANAKEILQIERGTFFGYGNLVVDMRSFEIMKQHGHPVIFDASHSVQLPGNSDGKTHGQRHFILPLARSALAAGAQGLFIETHPAPEQALSDQDSQIHLHNFESLLSQTLPHHLPS